MVGKNKSENSVQADTKVELEELLERILIGLARAYADKLENTPTGDLKAADLTSAGKFLSDNQINKGTLVDTQAELMNGLGRQIKELELDDDEAIMPLPKPGPIPSD